MALPLISVGGFRFLKQILNDAKAASPITASAAMQATPLVVAKRATKAGRSLPDLGRARFC